ncbi:MAG: hypothetical protein QOG85_204 [Gaiellaceae bacterium]|jgi:hypothetical protein|nr:hypothetical protein [Gaiellaceae bacterium]
MLGSLVFALSNLQVFDQAVDPTLAGTLAGLSLAAAAFLSSLRGTLDARAREMELSAVGLSAPAKGAAIAEAARKKAESTSLGSAVVSLTVSFGFFVLLLAESLSLGDLVEPGALLEGSKWLWGDFFAEAGTLAVGIIFLGAGAKAIASTALKGD